MSNEPVVRMDRDGGPVHPVEIQPGPDGTVVGYQTSHCGGYHLGLTIRELAAIEFTKVHLADLMAANCTENTASRIREAVTRGWQTADEWMEAREVLMQNPVSEPAP